MPSRGVQMSLRYIADDLADYVATSRPDLILELGRWLNDEGEAELMETVFNLAIDRRGYASLVGVSALWSGIGRWDQAEPVF